MSTDASSPLRGPNAVFPWDSFGVWAAVEIDNDSEFDNRIIPDAMERRGANAIWCEKARPEQRARIESFFLSLDQQCNPIETNGASDE